MALWIEIDEQEAAVMFDEFDLEHPEVVHVFA
jgi:hypothetical protein